jgi:hypothetical protein
VAIADFESMGWTEKPREGPITQSASSQYFSNRLLNVDFGGPTAANADADRAVLESDIRLARDAGESEP